MAWWQKKLLRYALSRTGLLDDKVLDLDKLDIALGKKNVVELKDVGLNIERIAKLAQLPPSLRIESARVLLLRLTVPADIYQSSIVAEVDGVELSLRLDEKNDVSVQEQRSRERLPGRSRNPQHRKVHRRIHSPSPPDPGGSYGYDDSRIPTTDELAKSFLLEEPIQNRRELEASVVAGDKGLEESTVSESSDGATVGTGATIGLPGFLSDFLQGIVDRLQVSVKNVEAKLHTVISGSDDLAVPVTLHLHVGGANLGAISSEESDKYKLQISDQVGKRVDLTDISLNLLTDAALFSELSEMPSNLSPTESRQQNRSPAASKAFSSTRASSSLGKLSKSSTHVSSNSDGISQSEPVIPAPDPMRESILTLDDDRFADAGDDDVQSEAQNPNADLEIQPGDDNITWGSRRNKSSAPVQDLWSSQVFEDAMPESLLLPPSSKPKVQPPTKTMPRAAQTRRDVSPFGRNFQSPGSWPRLDESPYRQRYQSGPGSWPALDQSQQSLYQPLTSQSISSMEEPVDNKMAALEASTTEPDEFGTPREEALEGRDALATSMFFTHEEAKSMYASAMAHSSKMHVPGGWASEDDQSESLSGPTDTQAPMIERITGTNEDDDLAYGEQPFNTPGNATPRAPTPDAPKAPSTEDIRDVKNTSRQLLLVDRISILIPTDHGEMNTTEAPETVPSVETRPGRKQPHMPGAFSMYSEMSASRRSPAEFTKQESSTVMSQPRANAKPTETSSPVVIEIGVVKGQLDTSCGRLLYRLVSKASAALAVDAKPQPTVGKSRNPASIDLSLSVSVADVWFALKESSANGLSPDEFSEPVQNFATVGCRDFELSISAENTSIRLGSFVTFLGPSRFLSFNRSQDMTTSVVIDDRTPDIVVNLAMKSTDKRPVMEVAVEMVPLDLVVDLSILDETFDSLGGLSGLLEAGNSMLSESGIASSPSSPKLVKGVRFDDATEPPDTAVKLKLNLRLAGARLLLRGSGSSVQVQATTFRAIYREYGISATVSHVSLTGPYLVETNAASMTLNLSTLRVEYLENAQHSDVERLLALLTPAHDKYDNDDDILLDTLIRQRKKGGIIRASLDGVKFKCEDLDWITPLTTLGRELGKLSAVTKYLPEDERPGILSFVQVKTLEAHVPVNARFGTLYTSCFDIQCAHVGLPALLAFSIGNVKASQVDQGPLFHNLVPLSGAENLPMVMGRMLGDEAEPATKIKLFNVCIEYSVSTLLNLTGLNDNVDTEGMVAELAKSVANLAEARKDSLSNSVLAASSASNVSTKRLKIDLIVHDSAIGLSPRNLPSKGLLVLADAHVSTVVPPGDTAMVQLDFRKAGLFIADEFIPDAVGSSIGARGSPGNPSVKSKLTLALSRYGYVSVGSVMAAQVLVHATESDGGATKTVDVKVRNELLLLETCADSTQTLIAISNGLAPPKAPSKQPKYLTEPMTIKDMMASFTGEAFEKPARRPNTLFDVDEEPEESSELLNRSTVDEEDDGLLAESEMMDSLYGPVSGILGVADQPEDSVDGDDISETAESLLEDDPFEMAIAPADFKLSDAALLKELNKQAKPAVSAVAIELDAYEPADRGLDVSDFRRRGFDTRTDHHAASVKVKKETEAQDIPFKLSLRDLHIIWNIYDGYDWQRTREGITQAVEQVESKAEERRQRLRQPVSERDDEESVIGDFLFNSIYIGVPSNHDAQDLRRQINRGIDDLASETESVPMSGISKPTTAYSASGRALHQRPRRRLKLERSKAHKVAFELKGVSADILVYPEDSADLVSSVDVRVKQLEIFDNVPTSTWRKFLTHLSNEPGTREMSKPMLHLELLNVRTLENFAASEITMRVSVLPLRLHVDQDALDFITRFFEFKDDTVPAPDPASEQPFIQRLEVDTVDLRLDYKPKKVDYGGLRSGHTTEFMNFIILEGANIRLKHAIIYGIKGFEPLHKTLNDIWMPDVKRNQLPTVLAGLAPVRSLVNIGSGVRDVVAIPVREYQKDGRIVRSVQKGAFEFGKTTASELARLGAKVAIGTQTLLKGAEGLLTPTSASPSRASRSRRYSSDQVWQDTDSPDEEHESRAISAYANQPLSVLSGLLSARKHLEYDLATARDALIAVQGEVLESAGPGAAAAAVAKYAPTVILRPIIGTSRAVGTALLGVGNQIDRSNARRIEDKYKRR